MEVGVVFCEKPQYKGISEPRKELKIQQKKMNHIKSRIPSTLFKEKAVLTHGLSARAWNIPGQHSLSHYPK